MCHLMYPAIKIASLVLICDRFVGGRIERLFRDSSKILGAFVRLQRTINFKIGNTGNALVIRKRVKISKEKNSQ